MSRSNKSRDPLLLIDGYNLLFESGFIPAQQTGSWLKDARRRLIAFIASRSPTSRNQRTTVVFDASKVRSRTEPSYVDTSGIAVTFAVDHHEADDLIEEIIRRHSHPKALCVISSDQRIRRKAKARRSQSVSSATFMDQLYDQPELDHTPSTNNSPADPPSLPADSPSHSPTIPNISDEELENWLREFG
ncbi:MAG: NYN domain-containing protein [Aureliella sp.]